MQSIDISEGLMASAPLWSAQAMVVVARNTSITTAALG
jgi:hypothetical protein